MKPKFRTEVARRPRWCHACKEKIQMGHHHLRIYTDRDYVNICCDCVCNFEEVVSGLVR